MMALVLEVGRELHGRLATVAIDGHWCFLLAKELLGGLGIGDVALGQGCPGDELACGVGRNVALVAVVEVRG